MNKIKTLGFVGKEALSFEEVDELLQLRIKKELLNYIESNPNKNFSEFTSIEFYSNRSNSQYDYLSSYSKDIKYHIYESPRETDTYMCKFYIGRILSIMVVFKYVNNSLSFTYKITAWNVEHCNVPDYNYPDNYIDGIFNEENSVDVSLYYNLISNEYEWDVTRPRF